MRKVDYTYTYNLHTYVYSKHLKERMASEMLKWEAPLALGMTSSMVLTE